MFGSKDLLFTSEKYSVARSLRFRSSASAYLNRTFGTPTSTTIWTWSAWVKRGGLGGTYRLFGASTSTYLTFNSSDQLNLTLNGVSAATSTAVFRDPSAWYHVVYQQNGSAQTIYVNNQSIATGTTAASIFNTAIAHQIGAANTTNYFDGYLAEVNFIDGQALTPSSFGFYDNNGVWQPKAYTGTYGTNGFYLNFSDNSGATATTIGKDSSGNSNNWTPNNISVTSGTTYDSMIDSPTNYADGGNGRGNYATFNAVANYATLSNANLTAASSDTSNELTSISTILVNSGKWYAEFTVATASGTIAAQSNIAVGSVVPTATSSRPSSTTNGVGYRKDGQKEVAGTTSAYGASWAAGNVIGVALDCDTNQVTFYKDNASQGAISINSGVTYFICSSLRVVSGTSSVDVNFGQRPFTYTPPSGFSALNTQNLPTPTISNGAAYMAATTYTGDGGNGRVISGLGFDPDFVWSKNRSAGSTNNIINDRVRGSKIDLYTNLTNGEASGSATVTFTTGTDSYTIDSSINLSANTYVGWQWKAGGTGVSGSGSGLTNITNSANASAGFSITTYTGNGSAGAYFNHGLGAAPKLVIIKQRTASTTTSWAVWHTSIANTNYLLLNTTAASTAGTTYWNSTTPDSTKVTLGTAADVNTNAGTYVAYCFASVTGYSAFGSYTGNGSASGDGPFVYTGFRPRWILFKKTSATSNWSILDTSRDAYNVSAQNLLPNSSAAETTGGTTSGAYADILSNGFKCRGNGSDINDAGATYIYAAFAETPFKIARAR